MRRRVVIWIYARERHSDCPDKEGRWKDETRLIFLPPAPLSSATYSCPLSRIQGSQRKFSDTAGLDAGMRRLTKKDKSGGQRCVSRLSRN